MVQYGPYDYSESEVLKLTEYLRDSARQQKVVHYDDAYDAVRQFGLYHGPHDQRLWHLLGLIFGDGGCSGARRSIGNCGH
jgi:hypothetical protein